jgi:signal transduction histidine kinase
MDESAEREGRGWRDARESIVRGPSLRESERSPSGEEQIAASVFANPSPLGVAIMRGEPLVIQYVNPAFRCLLGMEEQLVVGRPFENAMLGPLARRIAVLLRRVDRTGNPLCDIEMLLNRGPAAPGLHGVGGKGAGRSWRLTVWRLPAEREWPKGLALVVRDASSRDGGRARQESIAAMREINQRLLVASLRELELTERAEAANEAKSAFLATMSHELRTPLTAILGYEELIAEGLPGPVTEVQQTYLSRIKLGAQHLLALIDGILTLSRLDAGSEEVRREPITVDRLLEEAATLITPLAASKRIEFTVRRPESPFAMDTDHTKLRQILVNLLGNAVKFTDRGEVILEARVDGDVAVFTVRDTGMGISTQHLERIFDAFWQVKQTTTRTVGGSGLGLSVSRRLARLLGGEITVESTEGVGSTFTLRLPLHAH